MFIPHSSHPLCHGVDYAGKQAHVELADRMKQRDAGKRCNPNLYIVDFD